jgi:Protein of unknown function (DUF3306)
MAEERESFAARWSRLKLQEKKVLPEKKDDSPAPALPPLDKLAADSDFSLFMHPKVTDAVRRVALKKLFSDPHFNVPDPFEPYSGDWTVGEPIPDEMLKTLSQARTLLFSEDEKKQADPKQELAKDEPKDDEPGRQDT